MVDVCVPAGPAALADIINTVALELPNTAAPPHTLDPRDVDSSFDLAHSFGISHSSDASSSSDSDLWPYGDISFALPPQPAEPAASYARQRPDPDSSLDISLDISLISDICSSSDDSFEPGDVSFGSFHFALPPPPLAPPSSGAASRPIGLGLTNLYKQDGLPFDGLGVLSFGVRGAHSPITSTSSSVCHTRRQGESRDGLPRTFLEDLEATWAALPEHHFLTVIDEEWEERDKPRVWTGAVVEDEGKHIGDICGADTRPSNSSSRTRARGVERDTMSSGLKRKPASLIPSARPRRVWRA
ncbi:hypothetical protein C8R47DRAFT_1101705 [Mycena vitilis]|nr:hypothetical protein C8R47DRAFT_1101705 [Mycena vitilis]